MEQPSGSVGRAAGAAYCKETRHATQLQKLPPS